MSINDDAKSRLEDDLKTLEEQKQSQEKRFKFQLSKLDGQLKNLNHELQILGVKLKEKDQEVKLNDLKIKELKKQVPNTRLKPIDAQSSVSRKEILQRNNLSVEPKSEEHSLIEGYAVLNVKLYRNARGIQSKKGERSLSRKDGRPPAGQRAPLSLVRNGSEK